ncbi:DUF192 domain-containing protein [Arenibaculum sp.]|jgi:hypothetical protein|uniref:DUF192 domain-containing protein n=1 Tax=Arenibaculum sp. TaxID=2865862 RepID=UPI002E0D5006|nr:DUF192 domain-containing protein [Arenibaculum sp.]
MIARIKGALAALALLGLFAVPASATETFRTEPLTIRTAAGGEYRFTVEMAETPKQMAQGLMYRTEMAPDAGMLFVHEEDRVATMWMKNTYIPLDMLFIDRTGRIAGIHENAEPRSLRTIAAPEPVRAVLELNGGIASRLGIRVGDRVVHPAFPAD